MTAEPVTAVVDASALLAYLFGEAGAERFRAAIGTRPVMSAVNWSEVSQRSAEHGIDPGAVRRGIERAGLDVLDFTAARAEHAAQVWPSVRDAGVSLADRACLALALELAVPAISADTAWADLAVRGLEVRLIR